MVRVPPLQRPIRRLKAAALWPREESPRRVGAEERPLRRCACPTSLILLPLTMQVAARAVELRGGLDDDEELRYLVAEDDL